MGIREERVRGRNDRSKVPPSVEEIEKAVASACAAETATPAKSCTEAAMVNPAILERILNDIRSELKELRSATDISWEVYRADKRARRFVERTLHVLIEACLDAAQHIISDDGFREPTSYRDAFAVLAENNVIPAESLERFENMAAFRNLPKNPPRPPFKKGG